MIDINRLTEAELIALHNRIVDRLRDFQHQRAQQGMAAFRPGDVVRFSTNEGEIVGVLIRLNKKSVTVHTEGGRRWNVAPQLVTLVKRPQELDELGRELEKTNVNHIADNSKIH